jgi:phenylalanine-4-hydroxylase
MSQKSTLERIPAHLRHFVVEQDYDRYDEIDQAVWRFVLLQTYDKLKDSAHETYVKGLEATGIRIDQIPRIEEMDACLNEYGWSAVCVDGFIPPRAFQEFQSLRILTIATEIRTADHLAYTPAPDIIHESAGHAPIVPDPEYREFLERFGEYGCKAFSSQEDLAVYEAIRNLSDIKEAITSTKEEIQAAEEQLDAAIKGVTFTSEAAYLSRLHWWTVEYGLVGFVDDYKIYGAGILSSVGESTFLHYPKVKKLPLDVDCVEYNYDITTQQPQLFVVESFTKLNEILEEVVNKFAFRLGGMEALRQFKRAGEVGTADLNSGLQVTGLLTDIIGLGQPAYLKFGGPCMLSEDGKMLPGHSKEHHAHGFGMPLGVLRNGTKLSTLQRGDIARKLGWQGPEDRLKLFFNSGVRIEGKLDHVTCNREGFLMLLSFSDCRVMLGNQVLFEPEWGTYDMAVAEEVLSCYAGAADPSYWPSEDFTHKKVPKLKRYSEKYLNLLELYRKVESGIAKDDPRQDYAAVLQALYADYPDHWLLAWRMMEILCEKNQMGTVADEIKAFMKAAESRNFHEVPVTVGLKYLGLE